MKYLIFVFSILTVSCGSGSGQAVPDALIGTWESICDTAGYGIYTLTTGKAVYVFTSNTGKTMSAIYSGDNCTGDLANCAKK